MKKNIFLIWILAGLLCCFNVEAQQYATVPYYCDFEDSVENALWYTPDGDYNFDGKWYVGSYVSYSGNHSLYVSQDGGTTSIYHTGSSFDKIWSYREFYLDSVYPQYVISFKHLGYGHCTPYFGPTNNTTLKRLCSGSFLPFDSVWMDHSYTFSVDTPGVYRLSFRWNVENNHVPGVSIDDITITGISCLPPEDLTSDNISDSSATLTWQHNCVNAPMGYLLGYKTAGDSQYTEIAMNDTNSFTLTGLQPNTAYHWRVKTLYNDSVSTDWSSVASFQTDIVWVHPLPYSCDFEDATENMAWFMNQVTGNSPRWAIGHIINSGENNNYLYFTANIDGSYNPYYNLPEVQVWTYRDLYFDPQYSGYELSFDAKVGGYPNNVHARVYVGAPVSPTDSSAADNLMLIDDEIGPTGTQNTAVWEHFNYNLDNTYTGHVRVFFLGQISHIEYGPGIAIDNIAVSGIKCSRPQHLIAIPTDTTVRLLWQSDTIGSPETYTVSFKAVTDTDYTIFVISDTTLTLAGLQPLTDYTWKVRSNCSNEEHSEWSMEKSFKTLQWLATLPYAYGFEDSLENAAWTSYYEASQHKWCIGSAVQHNGQHTCYISKDNGATYQTENPAASNACLYRDFYFDPAYEEYVLEFDFKTFDYTSQTDISVYVESPTSPTLTVPSIENRVDTLCFSDTLWHHVSIVVNGKHSGVQRLVLEWTKEYWWAKGSCAVDDITFSSVAFGRPYALKSLNVNHNSALLSWTPGNRQAPASYQLAYHQADDTVFTVISLTDTIWQANSLMSNTRYHWKVRAVAADGTLSAWSKEELFYTSAITPYSTDFENVAEWGGWLRAYVSKKKDGWIIGDAVSFGGSFSLYVSHDDGATNVCDEVYSYENPISVYRDIYFVPGEAGYHISFDYMGVGAEIVLKSLDDPTANAVSIASIPTSDQWQHHYIVVDSSYSGLQRLFFNRIIAGASNKAGAVDNLVVAASDCPTPTPLAANLTAPNAVRFTWNSVGSQSYIVAYKLQSENDYTTVTVQDTTVLINNLIPDIPYYWKVRALCDGVPGEWSTDNTFYTTPLLPYFCDFEDANEIAHWTYDHSSDWNYLTIGAAPVDNGNSTLHVGSAFGDGNYNYYATARLWAYRDIYLGGDASKYQISFDYRGLGQTDADFARIYLGPPATPSGLNAPDGVEQIGGNFCSVPSWTHYSFEVDSSHSGLQRIYFQWRCNDNNGLNPGAAIDNITVQCSECPIPTVPTTLSTTDTTATLTWHSGNASIQPLNYTVAYKLPYDSAFTEVTTTDTVMQINGLQPNSHYYWQVRANCSGADYSLWSNSSGFTTAQPTYATLPYECGFEDASENALWSFVHLCGPNDWSIGNAVAFTGDSALYVSDDNASNHYSNSSVSQIWAYRDIYFTPGYDEYELSFDFKAKGSSSHYAKVFLGPPAAPYETFTPEGAEQLGGSMYNQESWKHYHYYLDAAYSGVQRLYVMWTNNTYTSYQSPAAFDNFEIVANPCREPIDLKSLASTNSATLSWTLRRGGQGANYTVAYRLQGDTTYTYVTVSDTFLTVHNLLSNVYYYWKVKQNCGTQNSVWSEESSFYTNGRFLYYCDFDDPESANSWQIIRETSNLQWYVGRHAESMPNGTLYVSADSGLTNCYNISEAAVTWAYTDVYVEPGHSTYTLSFDFKGMGSNSNFDYAKAFIGPKVLPTPYGNISGVLQLGSKLRMREEWTHYQFTFDSTYSGFQRIYFLWINDGSVGINPPASIDNVCISTLDLQPPKNLQIEPFDEYAFVTWNMADTIVPTSYTVEYARLTDSDLVTVTVYDTSCTLTELQHSTDYFVRVRANYANGDHGLWRMGYFHTKIQSAYVVYYCDFEDTAEVNNWQYVGYGTVNQWTVGTAATQGEGNSLYVSNDGGLTNSYTFTSTTTIWAYRDIYIDPEQGPYQMSFDFRGVGERTTTTVWDYSKVFIGPLATPDVSSNDVVVPEGAVQIGTTLYQQNEWTSYSDTFNVTTSHVRLYLLWRNDYSYGNNPAAAFDNISIVSAGCKPPAALTLDTVTKTEVEFHITDYFLDRQDWDVALVAESGILDESQAITLHDTLSYTFTQLDSGRVYTIFVRTRCSDDDFSDWISLTISTLPGDTASHQDDDSVGVVQYQLDKAIKVYPNPTNNYVDVAVSEGVNVSFIDVYDMFGRRLWYAEVRENWRRFNLAGWSSGMYLMRITTDHGVVTKRFVIQ